MQRLGASKACKAAAERLIVTCAVQDPFGNYVVQYVLELGHVEATATIMRQLYDHYPELAQQKFSSNVVEKCLKLGGPGLAECRERVIRELMVSPLLPRLLQVSHPELSSSLTWQGSSPCNANFAVCCAFACCCRRHW